MIAAQAVKDRGVPLAILTYSLLTGIVLAVGIFPNLRPIMVFAFLLVCPGGAFVHLLHLPGLMINLVLTVAVSLGIGTSIAMLLMLSGRLTAGDAFYALLAVTMLGVLLDMISKRNEPRFAKPQDD